MTLWALNLQADEAALLVDSEQYDDEGNVSNVGDKSFTSPLLNTVFFSQGKAALLNRFYMRAHNDERIGSFDDLCDLGGHLALEAVAEYRRDFSALGLPEESLEQLHRSELFAVGWSARRNRVALLAIPGPRFEPVLFADNRLLGVSVGATNEHLKRYAQPSTLDEMKVCLGNQFLQLLEDHGEGVRGQCGGKLTYTRLTLGAIFSYWAGTLDESVILSRDWNMKRQPQRREAPKVGRNDPCPCGSGHKAKKCCGVD